MSQLQTPVKEVITFLIANFYSQTKIRFLRCFLTLVKTKLRKTETTVMMFSALKGAYNFFFIVLISQHKRVGLVTPCERIKPTSKLLVRSLYRMVISYCQRGNRANKLGCLGGRFIIPCNVPKTLKFCETL